MPDDVLSAARRVITEHPISVWHEVSRHAGALQRQAHRHQFQPLIAERGGGGDVKTNRLVTAQRAVVMAIPVILQVAGALAFLAHPGHLLE